MGLLGLNSKLQKQYFTANHTLMEQMAHSEIKQPFHSSKTELTEAEGIFCMKWPAQQHRKSQRKVRNHWFRRGVQYFITSHDSVTGIVFTLWVFACVYVCVIMAKCGPGDSYCSGNYQRGGFESFARCLPATTATAGIVFTLWDCVSSWPNVLLENLSVAGNTSEAIFSTLQVFMCLWTDFVDAIVSQPCKNQSRNICVVEIKMRAKLILVGVLRPVSTHYSCNNL